MLGLDRSVIEQVPTAAAAAADAEDDPLLCVVCQGDASEEDPILKCDGVHATEVGYHIGCLPEGHRLGSVPRDDEDWLVELTRMSKVLRERPVGGGGDSREKSEPRRCEARALPVPLSLAGLRHRCRHVPQPLTTSVPQLENSPLQGMESSRNFRQLPKKYLPFRGKSDHFHYLNYRKYVVICDYTQELS